MNPYQAAVVLVNVDAAHNSGHPLAPAHVTAVNPDGTVNVRVLYDVPPHLLHRHAPEHIAGVAFHDMTAAEGNSRGLFGAFWPSGQLAAILETQEKIMTVQNDIDTAANTIQTAVSAIGAVAADLTTAAAGIQSQIAGLNSQIAAAGGTPVDTSALDAQVSALSSAVAALQQAQSAVDGTVATAVPAPAEGTAGSTVSAGDSGSAA